MHRLSLSSKNQSVYALIPKDLCKRFGIKDSKDSYIDVIIIKVGDEINFKVVQELSMTWDKKLDVIAEGLRELLEGK